MRTPLIVGTGRTTRPDASGERMTRAVLAGCKSRGALTRLCSGPELVAPPHLAPENSECTPIQTEFMETVRAADGLLICSPGYHGGVPGLVENALYLLEDLRGDAPQLF